jgi:hypothetical protein
MRKDFPTLIKEMRITLHPMFKALSSGGTLDDFEHKKEEMITSAVYTVEEFEKLINEYYLDFSSEDPEKWVIRHDPDNAIIITPSFKK